MNTWDMWKILVYVCWALTIAGLFNGNLAPEEGRQLLAIFFCTMAVLHEVKYRD